MDHEMVPETWERHFSAIWMDLERLLARSGAATAILLDTTGNPLTYAGDDPDFDLAGFGSLAVADFLATRALAALVPESGGRWVVHQGEEGGLVLLSIHPSVILAVLFDRRTTLGLVRHQIRKDLERLEAATRPLLTLLDQRFSHFGSEETGADDAAGEELERDLIGEGLARLFGPTA